MSFNLNAQIVDITKQTCPQWELTKENEVFLEDIYSAPFDFSYINDNLYITMNRTPAVAVYNLQGELISINDKKGEGPGELASPIYLWDNPSEQGIKVYDEGHFRYHLFDYQLNFQRSEDITPQQFINKMYYTEHGTYKYYSIIDFVDGEVTFNHKLQYINDKTTTDLYSTDCHMFLKGWFRYNQPICRFLSDETLCVIIQSRVDYTVNFYKDDQRIMQVKKDIKPVRYPEEEIEETRTFAKEREEQFRITFKTPDEVIENNMVISTIAVDEEDQVWVLTIDKNGQFFDIIDANGHKIAIAKITGNNVPDKLERPYIKGDYLYTLSGNDDDEFFLKKYRINK